MLDLKANPNKEGAGHGHRIDARQGPRVRLDDPRAERYAPRGRRDPVGHLHGPREGHVQRERQEGRFRRPLDAGTGAGTERRTAGRRYVQRDGGRPLGTRNRQQTRAVAAHAGHHDPEARDARRNRPPYRHRIVQGAQHHRQGRRGRLDRGHVGLAHQALEGDRAGQRHPRRRGTDLGVGRAAGRRFERHHRRLPGTPVGLGAQAGRRRRSKSASTRSSTTRSTTSRMPSRACSSP